MRMIKRPRLKTFSKLNQNMNRKNKSVVHALLILTLAVLAGAGCGKAAKKTEAADPIGTNKLETVFADAGAPVKNVIKKSEAAIAAKDYGTAYDALQGLTRGSSLNAEQSEAVKNALLVLGNFPRNAP
jgi:hypothetical protein